MDSDDGWPELTDEEQVWAELGPLLRSQGYLLRPRYQPGWKPRSQSHLDERNVARFSLNSMDCIRQTDGAKVLLKRTSTTNRELSIHSLLSSDSDTAPYTPTFYGAILLPDTDEEALIAMPVLHGILKPCFENVYELMDCVVQVTQALHFIHQKRIAHADMHPKNLLMDPNGLFVKGWHPVEDTRYQPGDVFKSNGRLKNAPYIPRSLAPPRYKIIDYGESQHFGVGQRAVGFGAYGSYTPPEMEEDAVTDVFKVDIWCFGQLIKDVLSFHEGLMKDRKTTLKTLKIYPQLMHWIEQTAQEADLRPTAEQMLVDLKKLIAGTTDQALREPLLPKQTWSITEIRAAMRAILRGHGNEVRMFALLRAGESSSDNNLNDGSLKERLEAVARLYRFFANNFGRPNGVMASINRSPEC